MATSYLSHSRKQRAKMALFAVWIALVVALAAIQFAQYHGVVAVVGEWQFALLGHAYPLLSFILPVLLLVLPGILLFRSPRSYSSEERLAGATLRSANLFLRTIIVIAAAFLLGAVACLLTARSVAGNPDQAQVINLTKPVVAVPLTGPTTIAGTTLFSQTAAIDQTFLFFHSRQHFAPIVPPGTSPNDLQFFVELPRAAPADPVSGISSMSGILRRNGLPGEIVRLYRYAGFRVEEPYYVLYLNKDTAGRPLNRLAGALFVVGLVFGLMALIQLRRIRRLEKAFRGT